MSTPRPNVKIEHTLGPWTSVPAIKASGIEQSMDCGIFDQHGQLIAECFEKVGRTSEGRFVERPAKANAAHIVHCVNLHEELVQAAKRLEGYMADASDGSPECIAQIQAVQKLIIKAEGRA